MSDGDGSSFARDQPVAIVSALAALVKLLEGRHSYITELTLAISHEGGLGGCDADVEFAFGLDLILDGLERLRA